MAALRLEISQPLMATLERLGDRAPIEELCVALLEDGIAATLKEIPLLSGRLPPRSSHIYQSHRSRLICNFPSGREDKGIASNPAHPSPE